MFTFLSGLFWQLTDIHYDSEYNDPSLHPFLCHSTDGLRNSSTGKAGEYGDYNCDSPWSLVISAIKAMKIIQPQPEFILWTGYLHLSLMILLRVFHNCNDNNTATTNNFFAQYFIPRAMKENYESVVLYLEWLRRGLRNCQRVVQAHSVKPMNRQ